MLFTNMPRSRAGEAQNGNRQTPCARREGKDCVNVHDRTWFRVNPAFAGWGVIFQRFWSDSFIMISALCWIDRGGHGEPGG
jgi:hypothetical protein